MKSMINPRIHVAPVGFEIDRIVLPAVSEKADLVYLLVHSNLSDDKATKYAEEIQKKLLDPLGCYPFLGGIQNRCLYGFFE